MLNLEPEITRLIPMLPRGYPVIELGAGRGIVRSRLLDYKVTSIEANPRLTTNPKLVSYTGNTFYIDRHFSSSSEKKHHCPEIIEEVKLPVVTLKDLLTEPSIVISDIEGTEVDIIEYDLEVLSKYAVCFVVEFHSRSSGDKQVSASILRLETHGFRLRHQIDEVYLWYNDKYHFDLSLLSGGEEV